jgi:hypothetical protein
MTMDCKRPSGLSVGVVAVLAGLMAAGLSYGTAWAYSKVGTGIDSRRKLVILGVLQSVLGLGTGLGVIAARRRLTDSVAVPAAAGLITAGVATGTGTLILAANLAGPASAPQTPPDVGA